MKKYILIIFGGAMLFWASPAEAESYYLYCTIGNKDQGTRNGSRIPKRPLCVDLSDNLLTVPDQVLGYTLTLEGENGEVYIYVLSNNITTLPENLEGEFKLQITNDTEVYKGKLYL